MVLSKQAVTKCRKNQAFIVPKIRQKIQHPLSSTNVQNKQSHIEKVDTIKFLGVLLDDNFSWKEHIKYFENKIAKNVGLMYRAKPFLHKESLLALYYSYIHSYLNYGNLARGSTYLTNLKNVRSQQKHAIRISHNKTKFEHTKELFKSANVLNQYKLNILSIAIFMYRVRTKTSSPVFTGLFQGLSHLYSTRSSTLNFLKPKLKLTKTKYRISIRGPAI